jgi:hypothetical protein
MPKSWFRHESQMRYDPAVDRLSEEFGPLGDLVWRRLLEVRCQADKDPVVTVDILRTLLGLRPGWEIDLEKWLRRASELGLIRLAHPKKKRFNSSATSENVRVVVRHWDRFQPPHVSAEYEREKKRRQRARLSPGTSPGTVPGRPGSVPAVSRSDVTGRNVTRSKDLTPEDLELREIDPCLEYVGDVGAVENAQDQGCVSHSEPEPRTPSAKTAEIRRRLGPRKAVGA